MSTPRRRAKVKNIRAWKAVRNAVKKNPYYSQDRYIFDRREIPGISCNTPACIAGTGCFALGLANHRTHSFDRPLQKLRTLLGLTETQAACLFTGNPVDEGWPEAYAERWRKTEQEQMHTLETAFYALHLQKLIALDLLDDIMYGTGPEILAPNEED